MGAFLGAGCPRRPFFPRHVPALAALFRVISPRPFARKAQRDAAAVNGLDNQGPRRAAVSPRPRGRTFEGPGKCK